MAKIIVIVLLALAFQCGGRSSSYAAPRTDLAQILSIRNSVTWRTISADIKKIFPNREFRLGQTEGSFYGNLKLDTYWFIARINRVRWIVTFNFAPSDHLLKYVDFSALLPVSESATEYNKLLPQLTKAFGATVATKQNGATVNEWTINHNTSLMLGLTTEKKLAIQFWSVDYLEKITK